MKQATHILTTADRLIHGNRQDDYGPPDESFNRIAAAWTAYHGSAFTAQDVAMMMIMLKVCRTQQAATEDSLIDIAGYAALASELTG